MATSTAKKEALEGKEKFSEAYHLAGEAAADLVSGIKDHAKVTLEENKDRAIDMSEKAESLIKERPLLSVGCAFLAGWVVSKILK